MAMTRFVKGLARKYLATTLVVGFTAALASAEAPKVAQMMAFKPKFDDVQLTIPDPTEYAGCEVKLITGAKAGSSGWVLLDSRKQSVRRFFDSNGDKQIDMWSYFKDGIEVYREVDSNFDGTPDQFRWLGTAGMKWGVDVNQDGKIDAWRMISAEEAGQEAFAALVTGDFDRMKALFPTEAEMQAMKFAAAETDRINKILAAASERFAATRAKLPAKATFVRVESGTPGAWPADEALAAQDVFKILNRTILYQQSKDKIEILPIPEMIQVGLAWRIIGIPGDGPTDTPTDSPKMRQLLASLHELDLKAPSVTEKAKWKQYQRERIGIVQEIFKETTEAKQKENWMKQIFDGVSQLAGAGETDSLKQLDASAAHYEKTMPGTNLTAYIVYRKLWSTYGQKIVDPKDGAKYQEEYNKALVDFVQSYPKAEDTGDALHQLAMQSEFNGKDDQAKNYYKQIVANFPESHLAPLAKGCIRRLDAVGQAFELAAPVLGNASMKYDIGQSKGKSVAVYYWASYCNACVGDFAYLKKLLATNKDVELVCVNLDEDADTALAYVSKNATPGTHVFLANKEQGQTGLRSPLAVHYGVFGMPSLFLVGPDGKVISRTVQVQDLEETIKKNTK